MEDHHVRADIRSVEGPRRAATYQRVILQLLEQKVDGLVLCPGPVLPAVATWDRIRQSGIPLALLGSDIAGAPRLTCVTNDSVRCGRLAAELLSKIVPGRPVAAIVGSLDVADHAEKVRGFQEAAGELGQPVAGVFESHDFPALTYPLAKRLLTDEPGVGGLYIGTDNGAEVCRCVWSAGWRERWPWWPPGPSPRSKNICTRKVGAVHVLSKHAQAGRHGHQGACPAPVGWPDPAAVDPHSAPHRDGEQPGPVLSRGSLDAPIHGKISTFRFCPAVRFTPPSPTTHPRDNIMRTILSRISMVAWLLLAAVAPRTASASEADFDHLAGQPANVAPSAYQYRSDRPATENPPEAEFLFTALKHARAARCAGCSGRNPGRSNRSCSVAGGRQGGPQAGPDRPALVSQGGKLKLVVPGGRGNQAPRGRQAVRFGRRPALTYTLDALANDKALDNLIVAVKDGTAFRGFDVPAVQVLAPQTWKPVDLVIEWGFQEGTEKLPFDGRIEVYNGVLGKVAPLAGDQGTRMTGDAGWESRAAGTSRRGVYGPTPLPRLHGHARLAGAGEDRGRQPHDRHRADEVRQFLVHAGRRGSRADPGPRVRFLRRQGRRTRHRGGVPQGACGQGTKDAAAADPRPAGANLGGRDAGGAHGSEGRLSALSAAQGDGADADRRAGAVSQCRLESRRHQHAPRRRPRTPTANGSSATCLTEPWPTKRTSSCGCWT